MCGAARLGGEEQVDHLLRDVVVDLVRLPSIDVDVHFGRESAARRTRTRAAFRSGAPRRGHRATGRACRRPARDKSHAQSCFSFQTNSSRTQSRRQAAHCTIGAGGCARPSAMSSGTSSILSTASSLSVLRAARRCHCTRASNSMSRIGATNARSSSGANVRSTQSSRLASAMPTFCQLSPMHHADRRPRERNEPRRDRCRLRYESY